VSFNGGYCRPKEREQTMLKQILKNAGVAANVPAGKSFTECTIILGAGGSKIVGLGAYKSSEAMPVFELICNPEMDGMIGSSLERLDIPGAQKYSLFYQLHNFGQASCQITARLQS